MKEFLSVVFLCYFVHECVSLVAEFCVELCVILCDFVFSFVCLVCVEGFIYYPYVPVIYVSMNNITR